MKKLYMLLATILLTSCALPAIHEKRCILNNVEVVTDSQNRIEQSCRGLKACTILEKGHYKVYAPQGRIRFGEPIDTEANEMLGHEINHICHGEK